MSTVDDATDSQACTAAQLARIRDSSKSIVAANQQLMSEADYKEIITN